MFKTISKYMKKELTSTSVLIIAVGAGTVVFLLGVLVESILRYLASLF